MEYVTLRNSDLTVSRLCMGGCPMGMYGWGKTNERELLDAIGKALELGVNFFDTADVYGLGQSERILGRGVGKRRKDVVIQSKFGVRSFDGKTIYDNSPSYIRVALDATLTRLKTDYVDVYVVHYWDGVTPSDEIVSELERLRSEGKIRYFGLSNVNMAQLPIWTPFRGSFVTVQNQFSLACRDREQDVRATASALGSNVATWGSLGQGVLTGKYGENASFPADDRRSREAYVNFHGEKLKKNLKIVEAMRPIAEARDKTLSSVAIRFILDALEDSIAIVGVKRPDQIADVARCMGWSLSSEELFSLDQISKGI